jgi:phytoene dehydrogenase-like protein
MNNRFSKQKIPKQKLDYIIIGSGPSGLIAASLLSKAGKKLIVLE